MVSNNKFEKTQKADLGQETKRQEKFDISEKDSKFADAKQNTQER